MAEPGTTPIRVNGTDHEVYEANGIVYVGWKGPEAKVG